MIEAIRARDKRLGDELQSKRIVRESAVEGQIASLHPFAAETIVLRTGRPVLAVSHDEATLTFTDAESEVWRGRLMAARPALLPAIRAVGRIDLANNPRFDWVGTGWLVRPDVIVTNRHVAFEFGRSLDTSFVFRSGTGGRPMDASVDFLREADNNESRSFRLTKILAIEDEDGPDLAFLQVEGDGLADPIGLEAPAAKEKQMVAVIGYPARDSRVPDQQLVEDLFGNVYDKKRLAPGQITLSAADDLEHDCSTLGGNSGSVVLDLESGKALGIHFAGRYLEANFAVPASVLAERLNAALKGASRGRATSVPADSAQAHSIPAPSLAPPVSPQRIVSVTRTFPITVTVQIGEMQDAVMNALADVADVPVTEGRPEDYADREGYKEDFLGDDAIVKLPTVVRDADQIVTIDFQGKAESELRYEHFSVIMNRRRRMCFFSAVNINGMLSRKATRTGWKTDSRIDKELQIIYECYGNAPKFSRGHMTRREDPVWGTPSRAGLGNSDSMHVTNVTPQMQSFNAPIWLGLEDYALQNARQDKMNISVFTGPVLLKNDPVRYGVKIPRSFWKVIAFLHDDTGKLTATGYWTSQDDQLPAEEFVFAEFDTWQRPLSWIENKAGVSFGRLTEYDPLTKGEEGMEGPLGSLDRIRF